jgi:hypothetical protein
MRKWTWIVIAAAAAFPGGPGAAQNVQGATEQAPIVVEGRRNRDAEIEELVGALPPAPANGHLSRFEHDACPAVLGVPPAQRAVIAARMRAVAGAAGVPVGHANCRPNVLVMVTSDKRQLIEQLSRRYPDYLGALSGRQITGLAQSSEPAVLWHLSGSVDADGRQLTANVDDVIVQRTTRGGSRITDLAHPEYIGSVLVVEMRALEGLTTTQLADYAAVRTFTGADPARLTDRSLPTILTLLYAPMGSAVPVTLTAWDLALLRSFYASETNIRAPGQRGEIQAGMHREIDRPADRRGNH